MRVKEELISIQHEDTELVVAPWIGGSVASFRIAGRHLLRPGSTGALDRRDPRGMAAFPLFPFSGRIARGRFPHGDGHVQLEPNFPPEPHAIHGQAWQSAWRVVESTRDSLHLAYDHEGRDWPWSYRAEQHFQVGDRGLTLVLSLTNLAARSMPAGLGWHPYFPKGDARLSADVTEIWQSGDAMIPEGPVAIDESSDLRAPRVVSSLDLDNAFSVGAGPTTIEWPNRKARVTLTANPPLRHLVVFTPPAADYFCVEPTSHAPDAVNSRLAPERTGYRELEPDESLSGKIELEVGTSLGSGS